MSSENIGAPSTIHVDIGELNSALRSAFVTGLLLLFETAQTEKTVKFTFAWRVNGDKYEMAIQTRDPDSSVIATMRQVEGDRRAIWLSGATKEVHRTLLTVLMAIRWRRTVRDSRGHLESTRYIA